MSGYNKEKISVAWLIWTAMLFVPAAAFTSRLPRNSVVGRLAASRNSFNEVSRREAWESTATAAAAAAGISSSRLWLPESAHAMDVVSEPVSTTSRVPTVRLGKSSLEVSRYVSMLKNINSFIQSLSPVNVVAHIPTGPFKGTGSWPGGMERTVNQTQSPT
jgi:hypothetical protein